MRRATWHEECRALRAENKKLWGHKVLAARYGVHPGHIWKVLSPERAKIAREKWRVKNPDANREAKARHYARNRIKVIARNKLLLAVREESKETGLPIAIILEQWGA